MLREPFSRTYSIRKTGRENDTIRRLSPARQRCEALLAIFGTGFLYPCIDMPDNLIDLPEFTYTVQTVHND
ncbi:TPA_asm: hypothetical protein G2792_22310 [Salmonella enterica subsp. enterica serovar Enteritidis]|uniref:Uncharacterized protein n=1 Tax=Salmonella enteritidis TaxID=149539 RepID=A0A725PLJ3_SALEN|nr:hypothetical protein [Salmonella enterica subsp. enterica serovar Enteritidis]HAE0965003.1 hypothetical protein [Salmonella enterica subsp. enterica serovar Enteritidis]HAE0983100.1 hypothetical protein [Salmonella enterica subsp. enterica serovar Enteritidis]HAE1083360.1 hypothetical protein [Salmonella enterica subsp. enterica serovar Enteritidis]